MSLRFCGHPFLPLRLFSSCQFIANSPSPLHATTPFWRQIIPRTRRSSFGHQPQWKRASAQIRERLAFVVVSRTSADVAQFKPEFFNYMLSAAFCCFCCVLEPSVLCRRPKNTMSLLPIHLSARRFSLPLELSWSRFGIPGRCNGERGQSVRCASLPR